MMPGHLIVRNFAPVTLSFLDTLSAELVSAVDCRGFGLHHRPSA